MQTLPYAFAVLVLLELFAINKTLKAILNKLTSVDSAVEKPLTVEQARIAEVQANWPGYK
jgi:hypothetical protein